VLGGSSFASVAVKGFAFQFSLFGNFGDFGNLVLSASVVKAHPVLIDLVSQ
jgi:hypothetical protein